MKRKRLVNWTILPLVIISLIIMTGCDRVPPCDPCPELQPGITIGPEGGYVSFMDDNVILNVPEGALDGEVKFNVYELPGSSTANFVLKVIVIEPTVLFNHPVQLSLSYRGYLRNGVNIKQGAKLSFYIWNDESEFTKQFTWPRHCSSCSVDEDDETVCMQICQTGVLAVMESN